MRGMHEQQLEEVLGSVTPLSEDAENAAWARLDSLTKPQRSLGRLESLAARVAAIQGIDRPSVDRKAVLLMAGDHGVVAEGVTPYPQEVTPQMVANIVGGGAAINQLAATVGAEVIVHDVGVAADMTAVEGVVQRKVRPGTSNMAVGPAMSREECAQAVLVGVEAARRAVADGCTLLGTGEMGIGNSTAAAALASAYTGAAPASVVGRGTGLDDAGVERKADVIARALEVNDVEHADPLGVLAAVGGLEIAALAGVVLGAAEQRVCVVADGFISGAAALAAVRVCPAAADYLLPSHLSVEPGHQVVLDALGVAPVVQLDMRLGEGTGAAIVFGIIDASCRMLSGMATFGEAGVSGAVS